MEPVTFYNQTTQPPDYLAGRRFVPLGSSISNAPTLPTPTRGYLFVWIYFKKSRRFNLLNVIAVIARVLPKQSPQKTVSNPFPVYSRIPPPRTKRHQLFKTLSWSSSNQNGIVPRIFLKWSQITLPHLALISPMKNVLKTYSNRGSNAFFTKGNFSNRGSNAHFKRENLFEPLFPSAEAASCRHRLCRRHESPTPTPRGRFFPYPTLDLRPVRPFRPLRPLRPFRPLILPFSLITSYNQTKPIQF